MSTATIEIEALVEKILERRGVRRANQPVRGELGKRLIGWIVDEEDALFPETILALEEIERRARNA